MARHPLRHPAERLFRRIFARRHRRAICAARVGMAPNVLARRLPALLALYIRTSVPESEAWKQHRAASTGAVLRIVAGEWKRFAYLVFLMTFMMFLSHGTQDLYPDFLSTCTRFPPQMSADIAMLYNVGAIVGAIVFGQFRKRLGRRYSMIARSGFITGCDSVVGLWQSDSHYARARRLPDASRSARRLGSHSRAPERTVPRRRARA